jgi:hypothetical protein
MLADDDGVCGKQKEKKRKKQDEQEGRKKFFEASKYLKFTLRDSCRWRYVLAILAIFSGLTYPNGRFIDC